MIAEYVNEMRKCFCNTSSILTLFVGVSRDAWPSHFDTSIEPCDDLSSPYGMFNCVLNCWVSVFIHIYWYNIKSNTLSTYIFIMEPFYPIRSLWRIFQSNGRISYLNDIFKRLFQSCFINKTSLAFNPFACTWQTSSVGWSTSCFVIIWPATMSISSCLNNAGRLLF